MLLPIQGCISVSYTHLVKIATSICGLFKDVEERVYRVYLNKSDILREKEPAEHIAVSYTHLNISAEEMQMKQSVIPNM